MKTHIALILAIALLSSLSVELRAQAIHNTSHTRTDANWRLVLPAKITGKVYLHWGWALEILEVRCDGKLVEPIEMLGLLNSDTTCFDGKVENVVYVADAMELDVRIWENGKVSEGKFRRYALSPRSDTVVVKYRVHAADGSISAVTILNSIERNYMRSEQHKREASQEGQAL